MPKVQFTQKQRERLEKRFDVLGHEIAEYTAHLMVNDTRNKGKAIAAACRLAALAMALDPETEAAVMDDMDKLRKELV